LKAFADLADLSEDTRIDIIGNTASSGALVGFVVDDDEKADRYVKKLRERFKVSIIDRGAGPVANTVLVRVGPIGN
jgi:hypothetical protein